MARLWNFFDGEPYLDNPGLLVVNPRRRKKARVVKRKRSVMARAKRRRVRRSYAKNFYPMLPNPRRKRRAKRVHARRRRGAFLANPRRRRVHRRSFRRNPPNILGFPLGDIAKAGVAVIAFPIVRNQIGKLLPASLQTGATGRWITNAGSAVAVGFVAKKVLGPEAGRLALIAIGANLIADAVAEFFPSISNFGMGYYPAGMPANRGLGAFVTSGSRPLPGPAGGRAIGSAGIRLFNNGDVNTTERLDPSNRF